MANLLSPDTIRRMTLNELRAYSEVLSKTVFQLQLDRSSDRRRLEALEKQTRCLFAIGENQAGISSKKTRPATMKTAVTAAQLTLLERIS